VLRNKQAFQTRTFLPATIQLFMLTPPTPYGIGIVPINNGKGTRINSVTQGGKADQIGLKAGDVLFSVDGKELSYNNFRVRCNVAFR